jgi:hypothetical protein
MKKLLAIAAGFLMVATISLGTAEAAPKVKSLPIFPVTVLNAHGDVSYSVPEASWVEFRCTNPYAPTYSPTYSTGKLPPTGIWVYGTGGVEGFGAGPDVETIQCQGTAVVDSGPVNNVKHTRIGYMAYWQFVV